MSNVYLGIIQESQCAGERVEQILHDLVVDLHGGHLDQELAGGALEKKGE